MKELTKGTAVVGTLALRSVGGEANAGFGAALQIYEADIDVLSAGEKDTGVDLPKKGVVLFAWVEVRTKEDTAGTKTIDVGLKASETGGDTDGFLDGISTSAVGEIQPSITVSSTGATNYISARTWGVLLSQGIDGSNAANRPGIRHYRPHELNGTARSIVYQLGSTHTELEGRIKLLVLNLDRDGIG